MRLVLVDNLVLFQGGSGRREHRAFPVHHAARTGGRAQGEALGLKEFSVPVTHFEAGVTLTDFAIILFIRSRVP
jgi:hypothetical protein